MEVLEMYETKTLSNAKEITELLSVSDAKAYRIIRDLNKELTEKGFMVISGRVSRRYFEERFYEVGASEELAKED